MADTKDGKEILLKMILTIDASSIYTISIKKDWLLKNKHNLKGPFEIKATLKIKHKNNFLCIIVKIHLY